MAEQPRPHLTQLDTPAPQLAREDFDTLVLGALIGFADSEHFAPGDVARRIGATPQAVGASLYRLVEAGEAEQDARGIWRAV